MTITFYLIILAVISICLIVIGIAMYVVPSIWARWALDNQWVRDDLLRAIVKIRPSLQRAATELAQYEQVQAARPRGLYDDSRQMLTQIASRLNLLSQVQTLPYAPANTADEMNHLLSIQPSYVQIVPRNRGQLAKLRTEFGYVQQELTLLEQNIAQLGQWEYTLQSESQSVLGDRIPALSTQIGALRERSVRVDDFERTLGEIRNETARVEQVLSAKRFEGADQSTRVSFADSWQQSFDAQQAALDVLNAEVNSTTTQIRSIDSRLHAAKAIIQAQSGATPDALFERIGRLIAAIEQRVSSRDIAAGLRGIDLVEALLGTRQRQVGLAAAVDRLQESAENTIFADDVERIRVDMQQTYAPAVEARAIDQLEPITVAQNRLQGDIDKLDARLNEELTRFQSRSSTAHTSLQKSWQHLHNTVDVTADPITKRYQSLLRDYQLGAGKMGPLMAFSDAARTLSVEMEEKEKLIRHTLDAKSAELKDLPILVETAAKQAETWACLGRLATEIKAAVERSYNLYTDAPEQGSVERTERVIRELEQQLQAIEQLDETLYPTISQLYALDNDIVHNLDLVRSRPAGIGIDALARTEAAAVRMREQARQAPQRDEAIDYLKRALTATERLLPGTYGEKI